MVRVQMHSPVKGGGAIVSPARCDIFKSCQDENVAVEIASPLKISAVLKFRFSTTIPLKRPGDKFDPLPPLLTLQNQFHCSWVNSVSVDKLRQEANKYSR